MIDQHSQTKDIASSLQSLRHNDKQNDGSFSYDKWEPEADKATAGLQNKAKCNCITFYRE